MRGVMEFFFVHVWLKKKKDFNTITTNNVIREFYEKVPFLIIVVQNLLENYFKQSVVLSYRFFILEKAETIFIR